MRKRAVLIVCTLAACLLAGWWGLTSRDAQAPSIILITVDTLRADHLGCYGYHRNTSPNIDRFARDGLLFEHCFSHAPETRLSFASLFSGFYPHETRIIEAIDLPEGVTTLAEILRDRGYRTIAVISNYVLRRGWGFEQGFGIYDDTMEERTLVRKWPERVAVHTTDRAIELLKQFSRERLFMWVHYQDPHGPYTPAQEFSSQFPTSDTEKQILNISTGTPDRPLLALSGHGGIPAYQQLGAHRDFHHYVSQYDAEILYTDSELERLIASLKELGLYENALIIFSSDHGEGMGEHDYFFAHGENLYRNQLHVPLILKYGNQLRGRRRDFVQHVDLLPTILNICGLKIDLPLRGRDLRQEDSRPRNIYAEMWTPLIEDGIKHSLIRDPLQLIFSALKQQVELFDIKSGSRRENNLAEHDAYRDQSLQLARNLDRLSAEDLLGLEVTSPAPEPTDEEIRKLRSLGYVR